MRTLVSITGDFPVERLKEIVSKAEVLANQPTLEVHKIFADRNPEFSYRHISVDDLFGGIRYHVSYVGNVKDAPDSVALASRFYSEEEVEQLRKQ